MKAFPLFDPREIAKPLFSGAAIGGSGIIFRQEAPKAFASTVDLDLRMPLIAKRIPKHAFDTGLIMSRALHISEIFKLRTLPEISPRVIPTVPISMIDNIKRPSTEHIEER
jgi:hypothetical protein